MKETNTKQIVATRERRSNFGEAPKPFGSNAELSAFRWRLFLKRFLRGRRIRTAANRTLPLLAIGAIVLAAPLYPALANQQPAANQDVQPAQKAPAELQQLVAPFALYPDALVAQILAASTYPTQVVEAERWLQKHSSLQGDQLAAEVDKESWDPSVKALTQFPSVLARMDQNLAWTSAVGDAYFNQEQDVLDAVQVMRKRAEDAGTLQSSPQQAVATQGSTIVIESVDPDDCYLPVYDPWTVYGAPLAVYPGFFFDPWVGPSFFFGPRIHLGFYRRYAWGWPAWGFNWGRRQVIFNHNIYVSRSPSFFHRFPGGRGDFRPGQVGNFPRGNHDGGLDQHPGSGDHGGGLDQHHGHGSGDLNGGSDQHHGHGDHDGGLDQHHGHGDRDHGFGGHDSDHGRGGSFPMPQNNQNHRANRGFDGSSSGTRSGAFSGFGHGGIERGSASRGQISLGGRGAGGGGGFGGGGTRGGGGPRGGGGGGRR